MTTSPWVDMITWIRIFLAMASSWEKLLSGGIFLWSLEICQVSAYILHCLTRRDGRKSSLQNFKKHLITQLEARASSPAPPNLAVARLSPGRPSISERCQGSKHLVNYVADDRNCVVCSKPGSRKRTNYCCSGCTGNPHLHPRECFLK